MKIYNTLTGKKEDFVPIQEDHVNMYVCGPTVYNLLHVGNMRCYVVFDTVRRYLEYKGYKVTMVQNFTDIDDKIIQRSLEENITAQEVADKYIKEAFVDADALGICRADDYPRVTGEMCSIIEMISQLIEAEYAYVKDGHVFFDAHKSKEYGKLSKKNIDDLLSGARIAVNDQKKSPVDFVLWKPNKPGEPFWESPWGTGRPGWHIECSAIAKKYLTHVDIHGGGEDLIFPHHENEIAQSEALQQEPFAKYWMHNGPLTNGHKKMSKSLGNFFTLREVKDKFPHEVIRFFLLSGHYRMPMEYSETLLKSAQKGLTRINTCWTLLLATGVEQEISSEEKAWLEEAKIFKTNFENCMDNDFNTADAISVIFELVKFANIKVNGNAVSKDFTKGLFDILEQLCGLLGLELGVKLSRSIAEIKTAQLKNLGLINNVNTLDYHGDGQSNKPDEVKADTSFTEAEIEVLITQRQEARKNKEWAKADKIRDDLAAQGIVLEDTPTGVRWTIK